MDSLKTLVILSPGFPGNEGDTTCLPSQQVLVKALIEQFPSLHIHMLAFQYPYESGLYFWNGVRVVSFGGKNPGKLKRFMVWLRVWRELWRITGKGKAGVCVLSFWLGECSFAGSIFCRCFRLPHYIWLLGQDAKKGNKYFPLIRPSAHELIAVSDFIADEFERNYNVRPACVMPVAVETSSFPPLEGNRCIDILGTGSLITLKQYSTFIDIVAELSREFPGIRAIICGTGPEKDSLKRQIELLDLGDHVKLIGEVPHDKVLELMQQSRIFLHPSAYEGFAAVFGEALYAGCHVVSVCRPVSEKVEHWHFVESRKEMLKCLADLLRDTGISHERVLYYSGKETAADLMRTLSGETTTQGGELVSDRTE